MSCLRWLHKACRKAGLRNIGWHTLRHTFASHLAQNGVSIMLIRELLGHSDIRTSMRYSHLTPLATREAIKSLNRKIGDTVETISEPLIREIINTTPVESPTSLKSPTKNRLSPIFKSVAPRRIELLLPG